MERCGEFSEFEETSQQKKSLLWLPDELVVEILEWLPTKSVVRLRCMAKIWSSLHKDPIFIENHRRKQGKNGTMLLVRRRLPPPQFDGTENVLSFHDLDSPESEVRPSLPITFLKGLLHLQKDRSAFELLGSCNGIVCIRYGRRFALCNPALRELKPLPPCSSRGCKGKLVALAHGYGVASGNDFKVIVMDKVYEEKDGDLIPNVVMVLVYSSKTNSWRQIENAPVYPVVGFIRDYAFLSGACHWAGHTFARDRKMILSFDINSEVYKQLELPDCLCRFDIDYPRPIVLNECIGLVQWISRSDFEHVEVEVWRMKEYGVESWTKMYVISPQPLTMTFLHWKNDIFFMVHEPILGLYKWSK